MAGRRSISPRGQSLEAEVLSGAREQQLRKSSLKTRSSNLLERPSHGNEAHVSFVLSPAGVSSEDRADNAQFRIARERANIAESKFRGESISRSLKDTSNTESNSSSGSRQGGSISRSLKDTLISADGGQTTTATAATSVTGPGSEKMQGESISRSLKDTLASTQSRQDKAHAHCQATAASHCLSNKAKKPTHGLQS